MIEAKTETQLPWHAFEANNRYYIGAVGSPVAIVSTAPFSVVTVKGVQQLKTDTDFIVRACNAHHSLLEALKAARTLLLALNNGHPRERAPETLRDELATAIFDAIDASIAKGETQ